MASPYLIEVRTGGAVKKRLREIMYDIANEFNVRGVVDPRPVPHITLFGPYNTNKGHQAKQIVKDVLTGYDIVPFVSTGLIASSKTT